MSRGFNKLFWGLILVALDFRLMTFDLLLDPVGYFIIVSGLGILSKEVGFFNKAQGFAAALGILSIPAIIEYGASFAIDQGIIPTTFFIGNLFYYGILGFLHIVLLFYIFHGMILAANQVNHQGLSERVQGRARFYIISSLVVLVVTPFFINLTNDTSMYLLIAIGLFSFIVELVIIFLIREFRNTFRHIENSTIRSEDEVH